MSTKGTDIKGTKGAKGTRGHRKKPATPGPSASKKGGGWLARNREAREAVERGLADLAAGRVSAFDPETEDLSGEAGGAGGAPQNGRHGRSKHKRRTGGGANS